jgi:hypothetical protein
LGKDAPMVLCLPMGPLSNLSPSPDAGFKILQTPELVVFLSTTLEFRQVFLDGRSLETDPNPSWMGYSVGHWEGDTLVVESSGFNDRSWLDMEGHPHTEHLRMTERFRRTDFGHLEFTATFEDPGIYARPIQVTATAQAVVDTSLMEYVCNENEKDRTHLIGSESDDPTVSLSQEALSKYAGTYRMVGLGPVPIPIRVTLQDATLHMDHPLFGSVAMRAVSTTGFSTYGTAIEFEERGSGMAITLRSVEGDFTGARTLSPEKR